MFLLKKNKEIILSICALVLVMGGVVIAGNISNNSAPSTTAIPYTLSDIYGKLTNPNYTANPSHNLYPSNPISEGSMSSLEEIYNAIPAYKTLDGSTTTVEAGAYVTTTLSDVPGSGLLPENIASGTTMFGIPGTFECELPAS